MYWCKKCNEVFDDDEVNVTVGYDHFEYWGSSISQEFRECSCPLCGGEVEDYEFSREFFEEWKKEEEEFMKG